jgi:sterol desaturase/sphingolipid hydroxylase (fatty acid hydroxylase superfamily)
MARLAAWSVVGTLVVAVLVVFAPVPRLSLAGLPLAAGGTAAAFLVELAGVGWARSSLRRFCHPDRSALVDAACWLLVAFGLMQLAAGWCLVGSADWLATLGRRLAPLQLIPRIPAPLPVRLLVLMFLMDIVSYAVHRLEHTRLLWWVHRTHHSASEMTVLSTRRTNPIEWAVDQLAKAFPIAVLGGEVDSLGIFVALSSVQGFIIHSQLPWTYGAFGRWVLTSPRHHRCHHAIDAKGGNYAATFPLIDHLFGTYREPVGRDLEPVGVA